SVIDVVGVQNGNLTSSWDDPAFNNAFAWGTRVSIVYDGQTAHGVQNGSTGSIALLNLSVSGEPGETSQMDLTTIQFSDTTYKLGTAPAKNGTFSIRTEPDISMLNDVVEDIGWSEAYWDEEGLWHVTERRSNSPTHSWWYGQESTGNYDTGGANSGCLVSKTIDLTDATDATLTYWTYWSTESWANYDQKRVEVSVNGGAWTQLEQLPAGTGEGTRTIALPVGNPIKIRFYFNTKDKLYNNYEGWFIDDITVEMELPTAPDLTITGKSEENVDGGFNVTYTVRNSGDGDAGASTTAICINGETVYEDPVPALAVNASYTNTVGPFDCPCGATLAVMTCADINNTVAESNETNNCGMSNVRCPEAEVLYVNESGWWREGGAFNQSNTPIQAAIDNSHSSCGTTIHIAAGMYHEQVIKIQ
ncbi:MAG: CARDB domain-containing protein, partial [Euryarchaeota archaeon]|nr:CARDB domain-containing protein [Euryarchaeota archaeon]